MFSQSRLIWAVVGLIAFFVVNSWHFSRKAIVNLSDVIAEVDITQVECIKHGDCYGQQVRIEPLNCLKGRVDRPFWLKIPKH